MPKLPLEQMELALSDLALALKDLTPAVVLVGGSAVEFYTAGAYTSGDIDLIAVNKKEVYRLLLQSGKFKHPASHQLQGGVVHIDTAAGVEVVDSRLLDGYGSHDLLQPVEFDNNSSLAIIGIEDLIADRLAQAFAYSNRIDHSRLAQARDLFVVGEQKFNLDRARLAEKIARETAGAVGLDILIP